MKVNRQCFGMGPDANGDFDANDTAYDVPNAPPTAPPTTPRPVAPKKSGIAFDFRKAAIALIGHWFPGRPPPQEGAIVRDVALLLEACMTTKETASSESFNRFARSEAYDIAVCAGIKR